MTQLGEPLAAQDFKVYMNLPYGIWMKYPSTWEMLEDQGASAFMVYFHSPPESPSDTFRENLNVVVEPLRGQGNLEQVVAGSRELLLQQGTGEVAKQLVRKLLIGFRPGNDFLDLLIAHGALSPQAAGIS